jgi:hypothetical protein
MWLPRRLTPAEGETASMTFSKTNWTISSPLVSVDSGMDIANSARAERWLTSNLFLTFNLEQRSCPSAQSSRKLTSTRSEHLSSFLVKARNREAYFACFGVPSIASLWALSSTLLVISSNFHRNKESLRFSRTTLFIRFHHCRQPL